MNSQTRNHSSKYTGRFAPSPTGSLHFGSLITAIASYLDAKANNGVWLVRMEDLDPPRETEGAAEQILNKLIALDLRWDEEVLFQSSRLDNYEEALKKLTANNYCFQCDCTRLQIKAMGSVYNGRCRDRPAPPKEKFAIRVRTEDISIDFDDLVQGNYQQSLGKEVGDFVILR